MIMNRVLSLSKDRCSEGSFEPFDKLRALALEGC
jgi:hypothetical protein